MSKAGRPRKIVSGGQTGADLGGLAAARQLGIPTGGWAPRGWLTEDGPSPELLRDTYGLELCDGGYDLRTELNVRDSDATVVFARDPESNGTRATIDWAEHYGKPIIINPTAEELRDFVAGHKVGVLNIAGNRESVAPGIGEETERLLLEAFAGASSPAATLNPS